jgi:hypothetical protein
VIPTAPLRARNHLAETILAALHDGDARRRLEAIAAEAAEGGDADLVRRRARAASEALRGRPLRGASPSLPETLDDAAALFDAGLGFEVHELLEARWSAAHGDEREALQGLIQVAVGYQHLANANVAGARALIAEGAARLHGRRLAGLALDGFARAALASIGSPPVPTAVPRFPR